MTTQTCRVEIRFRWWVRWLYMPLTRFGAWLGLPLSKDVITQDILRGVRVKVEGE